jgi:hypothetical protein
VVESPRARDKAPDEEEEVADVGHVEEVADEEEEEGVYGIAKDKPKVKKAKPAKVETADAPVPPEDMDEAAAAAALEQEKKNKQKAKNKKLAAGLGLAVVGLIVLGVAAKFILSGSAKKDPPKRPPVIVQATTTTGKEKDIKTEKEDPHKKKIVKIIDNKEPESPAGPELTNLLPNDPKSLKDADQVTHFYFKNLFGPLKDLVFVKEAFAEQLFKEKMGLNILDVDDVIRAERFAEPQWTFTVIHSIKPLDLNRDDLKKQDPRKKEGPKKDDPNSLKTALGLVPAQNSPINKQDYYLVTKNRAWLEEFGQVSLGAANEGRQGQASTPLYLRLHDRYTLVLSDEKTMTKFLQVEGRWTKQNPATDNKIPYQTVRPELKEMLDRLETRVGKEKETILASMAADLGTPGKQKRPPAPFRQLWDMTYLVRDLEPKVRLVGTALGQKQDRAFSYVSEAVCLDETDAKELRDAVIKNAAPTAARFLDDLLKHKVNYPKPDVKDLPAEAGKETSRIRVSQIKSTVKFVLDLVMNEGTFDKLKGELATMVLGVKGEIDLGLGFSRQDLARANRINLGKAALQMVEGGLPHSKSDTIKTKGSPRVAAGQWPPGAFPRQGKIKLRTDHEPGQRISWMAGLLPYLGRHELYQKIHFNTSWRDPGNWMAGRTLVPEFMDPTYPLSARFASHPDVPMDLAATHYVGIAGVGEEAADYPRNDPAFDLKRGIFAYDQSATLDEVRKGRGWSSTILLIQVPHDSKVGVTPWIAGGGSTVRGVPEEKSIAPFLLYNDKKNAKNGTYAVMADGNVRWIDAKISDEVFKAMCTVKAPLPKNFNIDNSDLTELLAPIEKKKTEK